MVESSWLIYGLRCQHSTEYRYVGMTKGTSAKRLKEHLAKARQGHSSAKYDWIRSHPEGEIEVDVLELCNTQERAMLAQLERDWIASLRLQGHNLLNHTKGGDGGDTFSGRRHTQSAKDKLREAKLGKKRPEISSTIKKSLEAHTIGETSCVECRREFKSPRGCSNHISAAHRGGNEKRSASMKRNWESGTYDEAHRQSK